MDPGGVAFGFSLTGGGYAYIDPHPSADDGYAYSINNANKAWDINSDGYADLLCFFRIGTTGFQCGDTRGILKGITSDGTLFEGKGTVRVYPCLTASR